MKNLGFTILNRSVLLCLMFSLTAATASAAETAAKYQPYDYSAFLEDLHAKHVERVLIQGRNLKVFLKGGRQRSTYSPGDPGLIADLMKYGVDFAAQPPGLRPDEYGLDTYSSLNPARDILRLSDALGLSLAQQTGLRKLRDEWTQNQTVPQAEYIVARAELVNMMYDGANSNIIGEQLEKVLTLERRSWQAFVDHYRRIVEVLDDHQREMVRAGENY